MISTWEKLVVKYNYGCTSSQLPIGICELNDDHLKKRLHGILNIRIPKTASRWAKSVLATDADRSTAYRGGKHMQMTPHPPGSRPEFYMDLAEEIFCDTALRIMVVRNPFDLLVSMWSHGKWHTDEWDIPNFKDWLKKFYKDWPNLQTKDFLFYQPFNLEGRCVVDIAVKYEFLATGFRQILGKDTRHLLLPNGSLRPNSWKSKKRAGKDYQSFYDIETRRMVEKYSSRELLWFNYSFKGNTSEFQIYDMKKAVYPYPWHPPPPFASPPNK